MSSFVRKVGFPLMVLTVLILSFHFRTSGLFRGLDRNVVYHPDSPKQVMTLQNYLHGHYVTHYGSLFYDGYPYGLNRLDELLIRAVHLVSGPVVRTFHVEVTASPCPDRATLFRIVRSLRALYGMAVLLLLFAAARRWGAGRWTALAAAALYGLAPLGATVSHSATGDIGVDLFTAVAIFGSVAYAVDGRIRWLALLGVACGWGFTCKFQGVLNLWLGAFALATVVGAGPSGWHRAWAGFRAGALMLAGFAAGILVGNPGFTMAPKETWRDTWANFAFIQNYGVPNDWMTRPLAERWLHGVTHNMPFILGCLGIGLAVAGLTAAVWTVARLISDLRRHRDADARAADAATMRRRWMLAGLATFPWMAFVLTTSLKPVVQPFHFSYLIPPLALSSALLLADTVQSARRRRTALYGALMLATMVELLLLSFREDYFWRRPDIIAAAQQHSRAVTGEAGYGIHVSPRPGRARNFCVEPSLLPVFRNQRSAMRAPPDRWWKEHADLPIPSIPFPTAAYWIFASDIRFPIHDRMFLIPATGEGATVPEGSPSFAGPRFLSTASSGGAWSEKTFIFNEPQETLRLGVRSGRHPAWLTLRASGMKQKKYTAPANSQTVLTLRGVKPAFHFPSVNGLPVWAYTVRFHAKWNPVWVTLLMSAEDEAVYARHGPVTADALPATADLTPDEWADARAALRNLRYLHNTNAPFTVHTHSVMLPGPWEPLAAGPYRFEAQVDSPVDTTLHLALDGVPPHDIPLRTGLQSIVWTFEKPFAPYDATFSLHADLPNVRVLGWSLRPDLDAMPTWRPRPAPPALPLPPVPLDTCHNGLVRWSSIRIPAQWRAGEEIAYQVDLQLDPKFPHKTFHETAIFLHLEDAEGHLVGTLDFSLTAAALQGADAPPQRRVPDLAPGVYHLTAGLFQPRTGHKIPFNFSSAPHDKKRRSFFVRTLTVLPPEGAP